MASRTAKLARSVIVAVNARKTLTSCRHQGLFRPVLSRAVEVLGADCVGSSRISSLAPSRDGVSSIKLFGGAVARDLRQLRCQLSSRAYATGTASSSQGGLNGAEALETIAI